MLEQYLTIVLVAIVLGLDAFSLSMGMGLRGVTSSYGIKFTGIVGLLHVLMPLLGLKLGMAVGKILGVWAGRVGAVVLAYIAVDLLIKGYRETRTTTYRLSEKKAIISVPAADWWSILVLAVSVSIDALTVGFGLGTLRVPILITVILMGTTAGTMTWLGFLGGRIFSRMIGSYAQMAGGIVLLALAVKLVV
ncbi:manganese efflux pump MntP [Syntrophomonas erecta subsp. sporosyntropha]